MEFTVYKPGNEKIVSRISFGLKVNLLTPICFIRPNVTTCSKHKLDSLQKQPI